MILGGVSSGWKLLISWMTADLQWKKHLERSQKCPSTPTSLPATSQEFHHQGACERTVSSGQWAESWLGPVSAGPLRFGACRAGTRFPFSQRQGKRQILFTCRHDSKLSHNLHSHPGGCYFYIPARTLLTRGMAGT